MRFLSLNCSLLLVSICILMQQRSVAAKPFIFKFFVPQAPARTDSSTSSSSDFSSDIDFRGILSTKLNFLTSLLRTGLNSGLSGGFNFGLKKVLPTVPVATTKRTFTSTTTKTPVDVFEPDSTTDSSLRASTTTTATAATTESNKNNNTSGADNLSNPIENNDKGNALATTVISEKKTDSVIGSKVTTENAVVEHTGNIEHTTSEIAIVEKQNVSKDNKGYDYTATKASSLKPNDYVYSTQQTGYNNDSISNQTMSENELSNEIMAISNQYLPVF